MRKWAFILLLVLATGLARGQLNQGYFQVDQTVLVKLECGLMLIVVTQPEEYDLRINPNPESSIKVVFYDRKEGTTQVIEQALINAWHHNVKKIIGDSVRFQRGSIQWLPQYKRGYKLNFTVDYHARSMQVIDLDCTEASMAKLSSSIMAYGQEGHRHMRIWQNEDGQFFDGQLMYVEDGYAVIRGLVDYKLYKIELTTLSQADQNFIRKFEQES